MNTYQVPLSALTPDQQVYIRTVGFQTRAHTPIGNVVWTLGEVRSGGTPLTERRLITHDTGTAEGGLQGAIVNFHGGAVVGNNGQNQTGLSHNPAGTGSLQWTDRGGTESATSGAAISWGNGTAWEGNGFNNRVTDLSNYDTVTVRMSATDPLNGGGLLGVASFFQTNNFSMFQATGVMSLPIDGAFHDLTFPIDAFVDMDLVDQHGIDLATHANDVTINVDSVTYNVIPEPASGAVLGVVAVGCLGMVRRSRGGVGD
jgi:hypothetical protein